ncbi:probable RNA-binding protein EIF1AD [Spodoptera litura]|uniref:Probable RNA-binding protein EIF1AD n=1 Tax=Spodoptera litura TaxID=69820 RepID=A0A9J7EPF0_SPOLT|nr:probable RNA-binding protein EIF1AD [Spodoptera litura]
MYSRITRRKQLMRLTTWKDDEVLPKENQSIVKVLKNRGRNLHAVITPTGEEYLVSMPTKLRRTTWVRRGSYIVVEPIPNGNKVKAEIVKIMNKISIQCYKENNVWPKEFDEEGKTNAYEDDSNFLFANSNKELDHLVNNDSEDEKLSTQEFEEKENTNDDEEELFVPCGNRTLISDSSSDSGDSDTDTYKARAENSDSGGEY